MRHVLATRRTVPLDLVDEYTSAWIGLQQAASEAGVRAWLFRGTDHEDHFMEFLEWRDDGSPAPMPETAPLEMHRERLSEQFGHAQEDRWDEAVLPSVET